MVTNLAQNIEISHLSESPINEDSVKWCTISLHEVIDRGKRLEASVFDVEGKNAREIIKNCKYTSVNLGGDNGLTTSYTGARFKRIWLKKSKYPIFQPATILDINPKPDGYISHLTKVDIDALRVEKGQVLLTCSGTIGNVSLVTRTLDNAIFSHDLLRINCLNAVDIGYIYTYLKSKIGRKILLTNSYGAVVTHIEPEHLNEVPIPNPPRELKAKINDLILKSYELRDDSNDLINEATRLLINELKLPPIDEMEEKTYKKDSETLTFSIRLSDMKGRVDASYHIPLIDAIHKHLQDKAEEVIAIGDRRISKEIILPGRFKRVYVEEGRGRIFIGGKQIFELDPTGKKYLSLVQHGERIKKQLELHENMILITCSGTIGKVTLVPKHWENWTANQHIIRIIPASKEISGYLSIFLSSEYGNKLITRHTYGSVVDEIDDQHVSQIIVPILKNKEIQKEINDLALKANEKRYEAYVLEQQAIKILEDEVIYAK